MFCPIIINMIQAKRINIGCVPLPGELGTGVLPGRKDAMVASVQPRRDTRPNLVCLAVGSGFVALLSVWAFPAATAQTWRVW